VTHDDIRNFGAMLTGGISSGKQKPTKNETKFST
jgi:hypothetical protein